MIELFVERNADGLCAWKGCEARGNRHVRVPEADVLVCEAHFLEVASAVTGTRPA